MTAGVTSLPIRSSPTCRRIAQSATSRSLFRYSTHSLPSSAEPMLANANKTYEAKAPTPASRNPLEKQLFPSSSPSPQSRDIRDQWSKKNSLVNASQPASTSAIASARTTVSSDHNILNTTSASRTNIDAINGLNRSSLGSLYQNSDSFKTANKVIDLTGTDTASNLVEFEEDDFSDDENLDLDFHAPSALPSKPPNSPKVKTLRAAAPPSSQVDAIPWSSSPASHFIRPQQRQLDSKGSRTGEHPLKRLSSGESDVVEIKAPQPAKRRRLPPSFQASHTDDKAITNSLHTPASKGRAYDPSASAVKEAKDKLRNTRKAGSEIKETSHNNFSAEEIDQIVGKHAAASDAVNLSEEQEHVRGLVVHKKQSVFFTGPAGTGKSVLMRAIIKDLKKKHARDPERVAVTASTGLAACNVGGITLHSFSGIGLGKEDVTELVKKVKKNPKARNRWMKTQSLIIDEISMVDGELFDKLDQIGRRIRNNGQPWGGIQLVLTGDFFQLPPVPDGTKRAATFAFDANSWDTSIDHTIGLTQVFRQRDPEFAGMLNEMRLGRISDETERAFKSLSRPLRFDDGVVPTELFPRRQQVESANNAKLKALPGDSRRYEAIDSGEASIRDKLLQHVMAPKVLDLKINAQVILIKNLDDTLVNGSLGKVVEFRDEKTMDLEGFDSDGEDNLARARRKLKGFGHEEGSGTSSSGEKLPVVEFVSRDGVPRRIICLREDWKVELPNGDVQAKRSQLPLALAWALSIHKAQGQTLERVTVNLGQVFEKGQAYVALSRATSKDGLCVQGFDKRKVMTHPTVVNFYSKLYSAEDALKTKKASSMNNFVNHGLPAQGRANKVVDMHSFDDEEEAMASFGL